MYYSTTYHPNAQLYRKEFNHVHAHHRLSPTVRLPVDCRMILVYLACTVIVLPWIVSGVFTLGLWLSEE
jgi:hypothetical protein